jgi:hypothetical protein
MPEDNASGGFTIDMTIPGMRRLVALKVLKSRLQMAVHFRRTDAFALESARGWALKEHPKDRPKRFSTMKQALAWVEAELAKYPTPEEVQNGTQSEGSSELE